MKKQICITFFLLLLATLDLSEGGKKKVKNPAKNDTASTAKPTVSSERLKRLLELRRKLAERAAKKGIGGNPFEDISAYFKWKDEKGNKLRELNQMMKKIQITDQPYKRGLTNFNPFESRDHLRKYWKWKDGLKKKRIKEKAKAAALRMPGNGTIYEEDPEAANINMEKDGNNPSINSNAFKWLKTACDQGELVIQLVDVFKRGPK